METLKEITVNDKSKYFLCYQPGGEENSLKAVHNAYDHEARKIILEIEAIPEHSQKLNSLKQKLDDILKHLALFGNPN